MNWITNFAVHEDPAHRDEWLQLMTPLGVGLILKSLKVDFKFVCLPPRHRPPWLPGPEQQKGLPC